MTTAPELATAIKRAYKTAAFVPEVTIDVPEYSQLRQVEGFSPYRRIDLLMFSSLQRTALEIKVSMADLRRETPYKWIPWKAVTHRFIYAIPEGMCTQADVVHATGNYAAGVWTVDADGRLAVARKASLNKYPEPLPQKVIQNMAYRISGNHPLKDARQEALPSTAEGTQP